MNSLGYPTNLYAFNSGGVGGVLDLRDRPFAGANDLGDPDWTAWAIATRDYLDLHPECNVVIWSWCTEVATATESNINTYLTLMNRLEHYYTNVTFVYMTGPMDGTGANGNLNLRNNQIRSYCLTHNKILYDFGDIESYDLDRRTNYMVLMANDHCDYDSDGNSSLDANWALAWQNSHVEGVDWYICKAEHSEPINSNQKAYAAWWLWARLAGWEGTNVVVPEVYSLRLDNPTNEVNDTFIDASTPDVNYGTTVATASLDRFLIQFILPPAVTNKNIVDAYLRFFVYNQVNYQTNQSLDLYRITRPWRENEATWNRATSTEAWQIPGGDYDTNIVGQILQPAGQTNWDNTFYPAVDVTQLVQQWVCGTATNNGFLLVNNSSTGIGIMSSDFNEWHRPFLMVKYTDDPGPYFFEAWRRDHFTAQELSLPALEMILWGAWADPDGDKLPNIYEYALGLDPWQKNVQAMMLQQVHWDTDGYLTLSYYRASNTRGVCFTLQSSPNLLSWTNVLSQTISNEVEALPDSLERVRIHIPAYVIGHKSFYRLMLSVE